MKLKYKNKKTAGFTLVELLVVIAIIAALAAISSPIIIRQIARSRATQALNNGKDIHVGIREFAFNRAGATPVAGADANVSLATLFTAGVITDEKPFFVRGLTNATFIAGDEDGSLETGENCFSYYPGTNFQSDKGNTPVLSIPAVDNATLYAGRFFTSPFGGQAAVIHIDGSGIIYGIDGTSSTGTGSLADGTLVGLDGTDLLAPSARTPVSAEDSNETATCLLPDA